MSALATMPAHAALSFYSSWGASSSAKAVRLSVGLAARHFEAPVTREPIAARFAGLAVTWEHETRYFSSIADIILSPSYQRIIGLGPAVVPAILREMSKRPDHWFAALSSLTGVDPVAPQDLGDLQKMTDVWLAWGMNNGLIG